MSGYFGRKLYDDCYQNEFINQQVNPCKYKTDALFGESVNKCHVLNGPRANRNRSTGELGSNSIETRISIESMLHNLDIPDSKCMKPNTIRDKNERLAKIAQNLTTTTTDCNDKQNHSYTRLNSNANDLRSVYINRYGFPIIDPTEFVYHGHAQYGQDGNNRFGTNTRLEAKNKISGPIQKPKTSVLLNQ